MRVDTPAQLAPVCTHPTVGGVNVEQRRRAGRAVENRIAELGATQEAVAKAAGVSLRTLHSVIHGEHWPTNAVRSRLEPVLRWRESEITRRALGDGTGSLAGFTDAELAKELAERLAERESHEARLRRTDR